MFKKILAIMLLCLICWNIGSVIATNWSKYASHNYWQRFPALQQIYLNSQYVNKHPKGWVPDEVIQAYTGGAFIRGINPVYVLPDTPPVGKYLIGLSALIFNNENSVILLFSILSLVLMYVVGTQIFSSKLLALIPPTLVSFEPIFKNQLIYTPLLDIIQLSFLLAAFIFFNKALTAKNSVWFLLLANIFVGVFIATKFFITGAIIEAAFYFVLFLKKDKKRLVELTATFPVAIFILLISYIRVFAFGYTINKFLGIQKWIFLYHKSQLILPFSIWPLMLFNKWYVWYGSKPVIADPQWEVTWPVITLLTFITGLLGIVRKVNVPENIWVLLSWTVFYFAFFSFGQITTRYFVILIPILYIVSFFIVIQCVRKVLYKEKLHA